MKKGKGKEELRILEFLEKAFELTRKKVVPVYPYNKRTNTIHLPKEVDDELLEIYRQVSKPEAVKRVTELTGAGLRLSKDYVDELIRKRG